MNKITLIGTTGSTGRLIAKRLAATGVPYRIAGRNLEKLKKFALELGSASGTHGSASGTHGSATETHGSGPEDSVSKTHSSATETHCSGSESSAQPDCLKVDVTRVDEVRAVVNGSSVVIDCAGPFTDLGLLVVQTCAEQGVDYLDTTGEQDFVRRVVDDFSAKGKENQCVLVPSCAFEYAFGDAATALLSENLGGLDDFEATYMFDGISTSRGTRKSVLRALGSPAFQLVDGKLIKLKPGHVEAFKIENKSGKGTETLSRFPFPGGEVCLVPLHTKVRNVRTNLTSPHPAPILSIMSQIGPMVARSPLRNLLDGLIDMSGAELTNPENTTFRILCCGKFGRQSAKLEISGNDPYGLTAVIAAAVAQVLHERTDKNPLGTVSASMIKGARFIREITEATGVAWTNL